MALSLRGHGGSEGLDQLDWLSIDDYVDDVALAADWLGGSPILVGHSMGGFVAQKYLQHRAATGLALLCSVPPQGLLATQLYLLLRRPGLLLRLNQVLGGQFPDQQVVREALFASDVPDAVVSEFLSHAQPESSRAIWDMSSSGLPRLDPKDRPPVLVIGAEEDKLIPQFAVTSTALAYQVLPHFFPDMGHAVTHETGWPGMLNMLLSWASKLE